MLDPQLRLELLNLLATHTGQPMDFVAIFMFLNTVAGGHYEDRHGEDAIRAALVELVATGAIEATHDGQRLPATALTPDSLFRLPG